MHRRQYLIGAGTGLTLLTGTTTAQQQPSIQIIGTNEPLRGGEQFIVWTRIQNTGFQTSSQTAQLIVGHSPEVVDTRHVTLHSGESTVIDLGYQTYPVRNTDTFPVRVQWGLARDRRTVRVDPAP